MIDTPDNLQNEFQNFRASYKEAISLAEKGESKVNRNTQQDRRRYQYFSGN
jgi:hypothetical protein